MQNYELYVKNGSPYLVYIVICITILPIILRYTIFKPNNVRNKEKNQNKVRSVPHFVLALIQILFYIYKDSFNIFNVNAIFAISMFLYIIYIELGIKYLIHNKEEKELYGSFLKIKLPLQMSLSLAILFMSIWIKKWLVILCSIIFGIIYMYSSYKYYIEKEDEIGLHNKFDNKNIK